MGKKAGVLDFHEDPVYLGSVGFRSVRAEPVVYRMVRPPRNRGHK